MNRCKHFLCMALINCSCVFTGTIFIDLLLGIDGMTRSTLWSLLLASLINGTLWVVCFSCLFIKKMPYSARVLIFAGSMITALSAIAVGFGWFPVDQINAWFWFVIRFLACLTVTFLVLEVGFRRKGNKYKEQLDKYHAKKNDL